MVRGGIAIYDNGDWAFTHPYIRENNTWKLMVPHVYYNNLWKIACEAGTLMIPFITSDGKDFITSDGKNFLVRNTEPETVLSSIQLISSPTRNAYLAGDIFDPNGMIIKANVSNGGKTSSFNVPFEVLDFPLVVPNNYIVPISFTFKGITKTINLTVHEETLSSIYLANLNKVKTTYAEGETFDSTNLKVIGRYSYNEYFSDKEFSDFSYSPTRDLVKTDTAITITSHSLTTTLPITMSGKMMRYIRIWYNKNNKNNGNHLVLLQVFDSTNKNVAFKKTPTAVSGSWSNLTEATNGSFTHTGSSGFTSSSNAAELQLDLTQICNITSIKIFNYWDDSRYYNTKLTVSVDGTNWETIFDSAVSGTYTETAAGKTYTF